MGKTKILFHFAELFRCQKRHEQGVPKQHDDQGSSEGVGDVEKLRQHEDRKRPVEKAAEVESSSVVLILCRKKSEDENTGKAEANVYDDFLDYEQLMLDFNKGDYNAAFNLVDNTLDNMIEGKRKRVVLLFDESHYLLKTSKLKGLNEYPGLLFRLIRLSLVKKRRKEGRRQEVMAVFTGTNGGLRNYRDHDPLPHEGSDARDRQRKQTVFFYKRGAKMFEEFFSLTSIGCLRDDCYGGETRNDSHDWVETDFYKSIPFGRPLFAAMLRDKRT
eukprot:scaffold1190_cov69-Cylindrotheca_fusiformis.AAC.8